jgi:hypothetical protein
VRRRYDDENEGTSFRNEATVTRTRDFIHKSSSSSRKEAEVMRTLGAASSNGKEEKGGGRMRTPKESPVGTGGPVTLS